MAIISWTIMILFSEQNSRPRWRGIWWDLQQRSQHIYGLPQVTGQTNLLLKSLIFSLILQRWGGNQGSAPGRRVVQERRHWQNRRGWLPMVKVRSIMVWGNKVQNNLTVNMISTYDRGRIKELIVTAGGLNIAPVPIESRIKKELSSIIRESGYAKLL